MPRNRARDTSLHARLVRAGRGDPFDRHVFACALCAGLGEAPRPLTEALGLTPEDLAELLSAFFPGAWRLLPARTAGDGAGEDQLEEPDLRALLYEHRSTNGLEAVWLSTIIARRSQGANHLWQDLGLFDRTELNRLMDRHFHSLRRRNSGDMKWKKFFYRQLCEREGIAICKAPTCDACSDVADCFGPEAGEPLSVLQAGLSGTRQSGRTL